MTKRPAQKKRVQAAAPPSQGALAQKKDDPPTIWFRLNGKTSLQALLIVAAGLWIYWPVRHGIGLLDDDTLVTDNPTLRSVQGLWNIWFTAPASDYWPLTWTLLWAEWHLWGNNALGYHFVSLALHVSSSFLVWRLCAKLGLQWGWMAGFLFLIHPLAVESVAWVSEIKNTLSLPFFLLALYAFIEFQETQKKSDYLYALALFLSAMLCKASVVMLPVTLLLYCWWRRGRITGHDFKAVIPFILIALILGLIGIYFQTHAFPESAEVKSLSPIGRFISAGTAIFFYLKQFFWPVALLPLYAHWKLSPPAFLQLMAWPVLIGVLIGLWSQRETWGRPALFGFGFFLINLFPALGIIPITYMNLSWVADHLIYLPMIGLIGLTVAGMEILYQHLSAPVRPLFTIITMTAGILLAVASHSYAKRFRSPDALYSYALAHNSERWIIHYILGNALSKMPERLPDAVSAYNAALRDEPNFPEAHNNLGQVLLEMGKLPEAVNHFESAIQLQPDFALAHSNLGFALSGVPDRIPEAISECELAIQIDPNLAEAHNNLGIALSKKTTFLNEAISEYQIAIRLNPDLAEAHNNLGAALAQTNRLPEAIIQFEEALSIQPNYADAYNNLALAQRPPEQAPTNH